MGHLWLPSVEGIVEFFKKKVPDGAFAQGLFTLDLALSGITPTVAGDVTQGLAERDPDRVTEALYGLPSCDVGMIGVQRDARNGQIDMMPTAALFRRIFG